ncbi:AtpZ/AtpI family protein [Methylobacterium sp. Leaf118]|uniref:AtpZ/AtpI family protein n=1 Tax=Methylobacterium sp. Leaf118 TaxID=2876562 RepID=UPI001E48038E|nr:AtpZ/AtpI family protein [Methylobacterium sp. Leaf118]
MSGGAAGGGGGPEKASDDGDLSARLKRLETQIEGKRPKAAPADAARKATPGATSSLGQAMRLSTEFIAGVIAGGILGYITDHLLGTKPWGMIVLLMLGFVTGIYNVMRVSGFSGHKAEKDRR